MLHRLPHGLEDRNKRVVGINPQSIFAVILLAVAALLTPPTIAGFCMFIGGRLTDDQLTGIGQLVAEELHSRGVIEVPCSS